MKLMKRGWLALGLLGLLMVNVASAADVAAIGDSMMNAVGRSIRKQYGNQKAIVEVFSSIGTGLARLDMLDWHAKATALMTEHKPGLVFVMMGANDNQSMQGSGGGVLAFGTPAWNLEYGRRAGKLMDVLLEGGATRVVWIGLPAMREAKLDSDVRVMEQIIKQQADARPGVTYYPTTGLLSVPGEYKAYIIQANGMPLDVRAEDGIHLNRNGAEYLADILLKAYPLPVK